VSFALHIGRSALVEQDISDACGAVRRLLGFAHDVRPDFRQPQALAMLLSRDQIELLLGDVDYILPRTACDKFPITKSRILREIERDADILLDLVEGMSEADARFLSVPASTLRSLISRRSRGVAAETASEADLFTAFA
jgi:hypothetical protein